MAVMWTKRWIFFHVYLSWIFGYCLCENTTCYPPGGVAGIVIATIVVTAIVTALLGIAAWRYWSRKKVRKKESNDERGPQRNTAPRTSGNFAFDNPYFRDQEEDDDVDSVKQNKGRSSLNKSPFRSSKQSDLSVAKGKKGKATKGHHFIFGGGQNRKQRAMDDTYLAVEPVRTVVSLKGHDFTGLGFNICGNMRDGILVKDVLHRGPASESGKIKAGDRIINVTVSFTNIVYEDALTILSYASPYDVQLELERTPDKSSKIEASPAGSKNLGSGSFSNSGPKLFHPLYRSQSIDDLTQIDRDTFPSHGLGPRRSQSVGVAAHKLASHFKSSDTRLEEKDRPSTSVILSTTGSLNEKMLANVMADGGLHKSGLHWEKRFEDDLQGDAETIETDQKATKTLSKGTVELDKETFDEKPGFYKRIFRNSSKRNSKQGKLKGSKSTDAMPNTDLHEQHAKHKDEKALAEVADAVWHLDRSIREAESDKDSSHSYPWNDIADAASHKSKKNNTQKNGIDLIHDSDDSINGGKEKRKKKHRHKTSSLGDLSQLEDVVKASNGRQSDKDRPLSSINLSNEERSSKKSKKASKLSNEGKYSCEQLDKKGLQNKEKKSDPPSPKPSLKSKRKQQEPPLPSRNDSPQQRASLYHHSYSSSPNPTDNRTLYNDRNISHQYSSNSLDPCDCSPSNHNRYSPHPYQQKPSYVEYQKSPHSLDQYQRYDNEIKIPPRNGPPPYYQALRKANPAGMFTQINPFQQPSNRRNNFVTKPWTGKDIPANGNDAHYPSAYNKSIHCTTSDSSTRPQSRMEPPPYPQKLMDGGGHSRTVLISSFENANNLSMNYRQIQK